MGPSLHASPTAASGRKMERALSLGNGVDHMASPTLSVPVPISGSPSEQKLAGFRASRGSNTADLRRRSSVTGLHSAVSVGEVDAGPASATMERVSSLTTFMKAANGSDVGGIREKGKEAKQKRAENRALLARRPYTRRRLYAHLARLCALAVLALVTVCLAKLVAAPLMPRVRGGEGIFSSLETVPYPLSTHPRTPRVSEHRDLTLADYLTTRLGSHFSAPASNLPGRTKPGSQLWLTTATNQSVGMGARHLVAFAARLEETGGPSAFSPLAQAANASSGPAAVLENREQQSARRAVVTLCQDEACMEYCRRDPLLYCYGSFLNGTQHGAHGIGRGAATAAEVIKLEGIMETLKSGRRVFWVDDGTYFREDPVPYMGDLGTFDLQIPESWTTGRPNSGFSFFAPTQRVISLFDRLLTIVRRTRAKDRDAWALTNLLLDPTGEQQYTKHVPPPRKGGLDENLFDDESDTAAVLYGQAAFESAWDGGIDVRVLDPQRFKTSEGRLGRRLFSFETERARDAVYWHCACCGDSFDNDYLAGALGYHQPTITYSLASKSTLPKLPLVLRVPELRGKPAEIQFAISLLLQIAHDSGRVLVPPLTGFVRRRENGRVVETEKYLWRIVPAPLWAHPNRAATSPIQGVKRPPASVQVREPGFVQHAVEFLRAEYSEDHGAQQLISELETPLVLDLREINSLKALIAGLTQPFWSTERVVEIEKLEQFRGKEGWELREEFDGLSMCEEDVERIDAGSSCAQLCPL